MSGIRTAIRAWARPARDYVEGSVVGSNPSRFMRQKFDLLPGVLYGGNQEKVLVATRLKDLHREVTEKGHSFQNTLYKLAMEDGTEELVVPRQLQMGVYTFKPMACNFLRYDPEKGARVPISFEFVDSESCKGIKRGGFLNVCLKEAWFHVSGDEIPSTIKISLSGLDVGEKVVWSDLKMPENIRIVKRNPKEREVVICTIGGKHSIIKQVLAEKKAARAGQPPPVMTDDDDDE